MKVDVAVIGGGPAGCSAAISLLNHGYSVAIISDNASRGKATETASPHLRGFLHSLEAEIALEACEPCYGISSNWGRNSFATKPGILDPRGYACFVYRDEFDVTLMKIAISNGAQFFHGRTSDIRIQKDISIKTGNELVISRWLVVATGSIKSAARITNQAPSNLIKLMGLWSTLGTPVPEKFLYSEAADVGWWYACPRRGGSNVCLMTNSEMIGAYNLAQSHEWGHAFSRTVIGRMVNFQNEVAEIRASPIELGKLNTRFGENWIAVGDAGMKFDPIASCGIIAALDSGIRAAQSIADYENGASAALSRYQSWGETLFTEFIRQRNSQYTPEASRRNNFFWKATN